MTAERHPRYALLLRWPFLLALGLLILNDTVLKAAWHNAFTGKLSDFAGVFAFAWFWSVVIGRARVAIHVAVAVAFVWWKSPWSAAAIAGWNALPLFDVARVVDYGDLLALLVLPLSYVALAQPPKSPAATGRRAAWPPVLVAAIAVVAFTATSRPMTTVTVEGGVVYLAPLSPQEILLRTDDREHYHRGEPGRYPFVFSWQDCSVAAEFDLQGAGRMSQLNLRRFVSDHCDVHEAKLTDLFLAMQPELRSRLGAHLLQSYAIPEEVLVDANARCRSEGSAPTTQP